MYNDVESHVNDRSKKKWFVFKLRRLIEKKSKKQVIDQNFESLFNFF